MAIEAELAAAGILTLTDKTVFTRDVEIVNDLLVKDDMAVGGTVTIEGDLTVAGVLTGSFNQVYTLDEVISDLSASGGTYMVIPSDGDGYVSQVRTVLLDALSVSAASLEYTIDGAAIGGGPPSSPAVDVDIAVGAAGSVDVNNGTLDSTVTNNGVDPGEALRVYPNTVGGSAARCRVQVEITRDLP